jgi:hypothetical protein
MSKTRGPSCNLVKTAKAEDESAQGDHWRKDSCHLPVFCTEEPSDSINVREITLTYHGGVGGLMSLLQRQLRAKIPRTS